MKLKEVFISLVGFFKCSIENNIVMSAGIENTFNDDDGNPIAELFIFDVLDVKNNTLLSPSILVIFNQVGDKIVFLYKKEKFDVISMSDNLIRLDKNGVEYTIERIELPL
jgi:hypothetical protein